MKERREAMDLAIDAPNSQMRELRAIKERLETMEWAIDTLDNQMRTLRACLQWYRKEGKEFPEHCDGFQKRQKEDVDKLVRVERHKQTLAEMLEELKSQLEEIKSQLPQYLSI